MNTEEMIEMASNAIAKREDPRIDEVALCFSSETSLQHFVDKARDEYGLEHFNSVPYDTMKRQDILGESFGVRFEFLRLPGRDWRIEAMCVMDGLAPIHEQALTEFGTPVVIHLSWKCENLDAYQGEIRGMWDAGIKVGEYMNEYGLFSYWDLKERKERLPLLKPRVNLRDAVQGTLFP